MLIRGPQRFAQGSAPEQPLATKRIPRDQILHFAIAFNSSRYAVGSSRQSPTNRLPNGGTACFVSWSTSGREWLARPGLIFNPDWQLTKHASTPRLPTLRGFEGAGIATYHIRPADIAVFLRVGFRR